MDMPLTAQVSRNVEHFIRRASMMGYIGESKDKVSLATERRAPMADAQDQNHNSQHFHAIVTLIGTATAPQCLAQMPENFMGWY